MIADPFTIPREELRKYKSAKDFDVEALTLGKGFRISIYRKPKLGDLYVIGTDHCQGIDGADLDAGIVFNKATWPVEQVAEVHGRWGPDRFDRVLYCLARYYFNAFICGERQFGLPVFRSLIQNLHYSYIYYQRDEAVRDRARSDRLGHFKIAGDPTIPAFRMAVRDDQVNILSPVAREEIRVFKWLSKSETEKEDVRDADLKMSAPTGMHDDLVHAGAYGWKGILEVHHYADDRPKLEEGKAAATLGMKTALSDQPKKKGSVFSGY